MLPGDTGDTDHIVVGTNGVFVIETKNNGGHIICFGDIWKRKGERGWRFYPLNSPSKQAKRKATRVREFLKDKCSIDIFVNPIVCVVGFSKLELNYPTIPIVRPEGLYTTVKNYPTKSKLTPQQVNEIEAALKPYAYPNHKETPKLTPEIERRLFKWLIRLHAEIPAT